VLHLLLKRPHGLVEHAEAYAELAAVEAGAVAAAARRWAVLAATALCAAGVAVVLGGVALMLWAALPALPPERAWVLWAVPGLPLLVALAALALQHRGGGGGSFVVLRQQLQIDLALVREAQTP